MTVVAVVAVVGVHAGFTYDVSFNDMTQVCSAVCCVHPSRCLVAVSCEGQVFTYVCVVVHVVKILQTNVASGFRRVVRRTALTAGDLPDKLETEWARRVAMCVCPGPDVVHYSSPLLCCPRVGVVQLMHVPSPHPYPYPHPHPAPLVTPAPGSRQRRLGTQLSASPSSPTSPKKPQGQAAPRREPAAAPVPCPPPSCSCPTQWPP